MIEPFFFDNDRLFGSFSPATDPNADSVVVVCPPLFDEYRRTYRALSELSIALAESGVHAFRFDYYGTGDSQGLLSEATIECWQSDIDAAIEEAMSVSGAERVILLGVRFGATLAAQATHKNIVRLLFWDPIISGQQYLEWLAEIDSLIYLSHKSAAADNNVRFENIDYHNFDLPDALSSGIGTLSVSDKILADSARCFSVATNSELCEQLDPTSCVNPGIQYDWPYFHDGIITQKPVLEALLQRASR